MRSDGDEWRFMLRNYKTNVMTYDSGRTFISGSHILCIRLPLPLDPPHPIQLRPYDFAPLKMWPMKVVEQMAPESCALAKKVHKTMRNILPAFYYLCVFLLTDLLPVKQQQNRAVDKPI